MSLACSALSACLPSSSAYLQVDELLRYMDPDMDGRLSLDEVVLGLRRAHVSEAALAQEQQAGAILERLQKVTRTRTRTL